jgi:hypothetical protein
MHDGHPAPIDNDFKPHAPQELAPYAASTGRVVLNLCEAYLRGRCTESQWVIVSTACRSLAWQMESCIIQKLTTNVPSITTDP